MKLEDLQKGQSVTLEIVWNDTKTEVPSKIVGKVKDKLLLKPYSYNGITIKMVSGQLSDMIFNLYSIGEDKKRQGWNGIDITSLAYQGELYYAVTTKAFNKVSTNRERRDNPRIPIGQFGYIIDEYGRHGIEIRVEDISNNGILISMPFGNTIPSNLIEIEWSDTVYGRKFTVFVKARYRREFMKDRRMMYGLEISSPDKNFIMYLLSKKNE